MGQEEDEKGMIRVREFDMERDLKAVEEMERRCEVMGSTTAAAGGGDGKKKKRTNTTALYMDLLGDPLCRVRHAPDHVMLVAEYGEKKEMAGVLRACVKMVSPGRAPAAGRPAYVKVAYLLGLRVSPSHRRLGIGTRLVERAEAWCAASGAEYAYMATDASNAASLSLFVRRLSYRPFRRPRILAHPVGARPLPLDPSSASFLRLPPPIAASLYARLLPPSAAEFRPSDLPSLLSHPLSLATLLAFPASAPAPSALSLEQGRLPPSLALLSVWDCTRVFRLRVAGAPAAARAALALLRALDAHAPWLRLPSLRDVFRPFGVYFLYGLHMAGPEGPALMRSLCRMAHNVAVADGGCAAVVAEVGPGDPVRAAVPHWRRLSCDDVWCMKRLRLAGGDDDDWMTPHQPSAEVIFVDPREF